MIEGTSNLNISLDTLKMHDRLQMQWVLRKALLFSIFVAQNLIAFKPVAQEFPKESLPQEKPAPVDQKQVAKQKHEENLKKLKALADRVKQAQENFRSVQKKMRTPESNQAPRKTEGAKAFLVKSSPADNARRREAHKARMAKIFQRMSAAQADIPPKVSDREQENIIDRARLNYIAKKYSEATEKFKAGDLAEAERINAESIKELARIKTVEDQRIPGVADSQDRIKISKRAALISRFVERLNVRLSKSNLKETRDEEQKGAYKRYIASAPQRVASQGSSSDQKLIFASVPNNETRNSNRNFEASKASR